MNFITEELGNPYRCVLKKSNTLIFDMKKKFIFKGFVFSKESAVIIIALPLTTICYGLVNVSYLTVLTPQEIISSDVVAVASRRSI